MNSIRNYLIVLAFLPFITACSNSFQTSKVQYKDYRINTKQPANKNLTSMLQPYADSVNKTMNDVLAEAAMPLEKKQPEGTLGNVLADAMLDQAQKNYQQTINAVFINAGGIRLPSIPAGNITRGKIFEMAPFDNLIVVLQLKGSVLQSFLNLIAARGGWPCAGIQFSIKDKLATQVLLNNKPLEQDKIYTIATLDYIANGGDDCTMLKNVPQLNNGFLFRDAVIQYCKQQQQQGKKIQSSIQNRVTNVQ
jgi:2',3'-cyclic-nucleotide 2'-phosphodiesterase (5'-nucleotidase family)